MSDQNPLHTEVRLGRPVWLGPLAPGRYEVTARPGGAVLVTPLPLAPGPPARFVDATGRGWRNDSVGCGIQDPIVAVFPPISEGILAAPPGPQLWQFSRVQAERGPLRPVEAPDDRDIDTLMVLLASAGVRAAGALLFAVHCLYDRCVAHDGHPYRMTAGHPSSWEGDVLLDLAAHCVPQNQVADLDDDLLDNIYKVLYRWLFDPARHVELAERLSVLFGRLVDVRGWERTTTPWIRQAELAYPAEQFLCSKTARGQIEQAAVQA